MLVRKLERKRQLRRSRRRWESTRMDLRDIGWEGVDWLDLGQDRDQWRILWTPQQWAFGL